MRAQCVSTPAARPASSQTRPKAVSLSRAEAAYVCIALCSNATDALAVTGIRKIVHVRFPTIAVFVLVRCAIVF